MMKTRSLQYAGNVGTGFSDNTLHDLKVKLDKVAAEQSTICRAGDIEKNAHWVKPTLVAEVSFGEWTRDGHIRHSVFQGLRTDKKAEAIVREKPVHTDSMQNLRTRLPIPSLKVSHPERVIDPIDRIYENRPHSVLFAGRAL